LSQLAIDILLSFMVAAAWLGVAGFLRLRTTLDRIHCVTFVNAMAGMALTVVAFISDGPSDRALKILLLTVVSLLVGASLSHATGRALLLRGSAPEAEGLAHLVVASDAHDADGTLG